MRRKRGEHSKFVYSIILIPLYFMKVFLLMFGIYFLFLAVLPCSDRHHNFQNEMIKKEISHHHDHDSDNIDLCSPFCVCACCSISIAFLHNFFACLPLKPLLLSKEKYLIFTNNITSVLRGDIWQPPRID